MSWGNRTKKETKERKRSTKNKIIDFYSFVIKVAAKASLMTTNAARGTHASHLTGCGGRRRTERWLNGSDVGMLWGRHRWIRSRAGGKKRVSHADGRQEPFLLAETEHLVHGTFFLASVTTGAVCSCFMNKKHCKTHKRTGLFHLETNIT